MGTKRIIIGIFIGMFLFTVLGLGFIARGSTDSGQTKTLTAYMTAKGHKKSSSSQSSSSSSAVSSSSSAVSSSSSSSSSSVSSAPSLSSVSSTPTPPPPAIPSRFFLGFAVKYYSTDVSSLNAMKNNKASIDGAATMTYNVGSTGVLTGSIPTDQLSYAKANGILPILAVINSEGSGFSSAVAQSILTNTTYKEVFLNNLLNAALTNGYSGVNIDFESVSYTLRNQYTQLIRDLKALMSANGLLTTVSIPAKTSDSPTNSWSGAYDYAALGAIADKVCIMTYDEHGSWGAAGPVASYNWVNSVINFAVSVIPREKILIGLAGYGYDWASTGNKALSLTQIDNLIATYGGAVTFDSVSKSPTYTYTVSGVTHTVWFENYQSIALKCDIANIYNIGGVCMWRLGLENAAFWSAVNSKFS